MTLYELAHEWVRIQNAAGDIESPEAAQEWTDSIDKIEGSIRDKVLAIARVVKNMLGELDAIKAEQQRLASRAKTVQNGIDRLKEYAQYHMEQADIDKASDELFTVALQNNPPRVDDYEPGKIPQAYWKQADPQLDRRALLDALKAGEEVPGAALMHSRGLRIR
ncbi:MAG: siphovirus Gp157 family protein [Cyclobacteriaceae bacterium]|nr:siphovirus Gp157 family protein [Cyclobacteriaceae bacterium]